ncbi:MAG: molecular chaperone TorD family protein [Gemmatimonadetes bacterium]|nr:molecular chaperone TorD family protein [Gemmatimonadota bacterium]
MELLRALGSLIEPPSHEHSRVAAAIGLPLPPGPSVHGTVVAFQRYPYASVYLGPEGMMGGEARDRVAGFRRALGVDAETDEDHLASLLALLAALDGWQREELAEARRVLLAQARVTLVWEHVASWLGPYLASFDGCGDAFYEAWADLLGEAMNEVTGEMELPRYLPAALREAPGLADPRREGGGAFLAGLLAPVRAGVIILRDDLVRLGDEVGLACRAGERRYVLRSFFAQDPAGTLRWLAGHARGWSERVAGRGPEPIARWWSGRACESARLLAGLAEGAVDEGVAAAGGTGQ